MQIAKSFGAEVTGVCSTRNLDMVRSIGADQVIDYTQEDFTQNGGRYDLIFDNVGKRSLSDCKRALSPKGIYVDVVAPYSPVRMLQILWVSMTGSKKMVAFVTKPNKKDLVVLQELLEAGGDKLFRGENGRILLEHQPVNPVIPNFRWILWKKPFNKWVLDENLVLDTT